MKRTLNSITQCSIIGGVYLINFISFIYSISLEITFPYEKFINPKSVVRLFFDILHGIDRADIPLVVALEFAILFEETEDKINLIEELRKLIMGKFDDDKNTFYEWSQTGSILNCNDEIFLEYSYNRSR